MSEHTKEVSAQEIVIRLHDLARSFEQKTGQNQLTRELRRCADQVSDLVKYRGA